MEPKSILVLQFRTDASLEHEQQCLSRQMSLPREVFDCVNLYDPSVDYNEIMQIVAADTRPVILGGSGEYYIFKENDTPEKQARVDRFLKEFPSILNYMFEQKRWMLGICYGHQFMSYIRGGHVVADTQYAETGIYEITLNEAGQSSPLFEDMPQKFNAILGHHVSVVGAPEGAEILATSEACPIQALKFNDKVYSAQFHPEMDYPALQERLALYPSYGDNASNDSMEEGKDLSVVTKVLENFKKMITA